MYVALFRHKQHFIFYFERFNQFFDVFELCSSTHEHQPYVVSRLAQNGKRLHQKRNILLKLESSDMPYDFAVFKTVVRFQFPFFLVGNVESVKVYGVAHKVGVLCGFLTVEPIYTQPAAPRKVGCKPRRDMLQARLDEVHEPFFLVGCRMSVANAMLYSCLLCCE